MPAEFIVESMAVIQDPNGSQLLTLCDHQGNVLRVRVHPVDVRPLAKTMWNLAHDRPGHAEPVELKIDLESPA